MTSTVLCIVTFAVLGLTALALRRRDSGDPPDAPSPGDAPASNPVDVIVRAIREGAPR
jgi:hypothetical protein